MHESVRPRTQSQAYETIKRLGAPSQESIGSKVSQPEAAGSESPDLTIDLLRRERIWTTSVRERFEACVSSVAASGIRFFSGKPIEESQRLAAPPEAPIPPDLGSVHFVWG